MDKGVDVYTYSEYNMCNIYIIYIYTSDLLIYITSR